MADLKDRIVYVAPGGKSLHKNKDCAGTNANPTNARHAVNEGYAVCRVCVSGRLATDIIQNTDITVKEYYNGER